jgi:diguanylate cyclase (GGDEF)-like protein/PAS domain S-box-containing protein
MDKMQFSLPVVALLMVWVGCLYRGRWTERHQALLAMAESRAMLLGMTDSKEAGDRLRQLSVAVEQSPASVVITDLSACIVYVNARFTEVTGYSSSEALGQNPRMLHSRLTPQSTFTKLWKTLNSGNVWRGEFINQRKNGDIYWEEAQIVPVKSADGSVTHYVAVKTDITDRKQQEDRVRKSALVDAQAQSRLNAAEIKQLACYDALTLLPNRRLLQEKLLQALKASACGGHWGAILFIDLDDFKTVNEALGHDKGDSLLQQVALNLPACVGDNDTVARLGSDEFAVLLEGLEHKLQDASAQAGRVAEKILQTLNQTYQLGNCRHHSTVSVGIALFDGAQPCGIEVPMQQAELAMYHAKAAGHNSLRYFDPGMQSRVSARAALEMGLREALDKGQFQLWYQPQVRGAGQLTGAEALVRWNDPVRGLVSPAAFIPLAEETGLILPLGTWVLETACRQLTRWAGMPAFAELTVAVNVSARQFHQPDFVDQVLAVLARTGANPRRLKIELTESLLVSNVDEVTAKMTALKGLGIDFSLDDFGTGYSSLSYLKRLPLSQLKIDQGFVRDIVVNSNDAAIAKMVIALADSLGLAVIAEGVETEVQRNFLEQLGCHAFQGYLFSRPLTRDAFEAYVRTPAAGAAHSIRHNGTVELPEPLAMPL